MTKKASLTLPRAAVVALSVLLVLDAFASYYQHLPTTWEMHRADFHAYYWAGKRIREGRIAELYSTEGRNDAGRRIRVKDFKNIPLVGVPFIPFSHLRYGTAWKAWWLVSAGFALIGFVAACRWVRRRYDWWVFAASAMLWASAHYFPIVKAFRLGQTTQLVTTLLFLGYLALASRREVWGGVALGLCAVLKIPATLFGAFLLLTRRWRASIAFFAIGAISAVLSVALFGWDIHRVWFHDVIKVNWGTVFTALNNQSFVSQSMRMVSDESLVSYTPVPLPPEIALLQWILVVAITLLWIKERRRLPSTENRLDLDFVMCIALMPFVYPVFWIHYFLFTLVALIILWRFVLEEVHKRRVLLACLLTGVFVPAAVFPPYVPRWYLGRETEFWPEFLLGRFLYSSALLVATCFVAARTFRSDQPA